jgi:hypothetical protein
VVDNQQAATQAAAAGRGVQVCKGDALVDALAAEEEAAPTAVMPTPQRRKKAVAIQTLAL